jgi:hypothetical protein
MTHKSLQFTDRIADLLGFGEFCDENWVSGTRTLWFGNGALLTLIRVNEREDDSDFLVRDGDFIGEHFLYESTLLDRQVEIFFLHDLYQCIKEEWPEYLQSFVATCKMLKMQSYIPNEQC